MRTTRALAVSPSMLCAGGVSGPGGMSGPGGAVCSWRGVYSQGDVCSRGVSALGGMVSQHALRQTPFKNIDLPQTSFAGGDNMTRGYSVGQISMDTVSFARLMNRLYELFVRK